MCVREQEIIRGNGENVYHIACYIRGVKISCFDCFLTFVVKFSWIAIHLFLISWFNFCVVDITTKNTKFSPSKITRYTVVQWNINRGITMAIGSLTDLYARCLCLVIRVLVHVL